MKKLLSAIILFVAIMDASAQNSGNSVSLNGITMDSKITMTKSYKNFIDSNKFLLQQQSVWYDAETFKAMISFLDEAQKTQSEIDGVRIYFGIIGDPKNKFDFKLILVATVDAGPCTNGCPSKRLHKDIYFDPSNPLFQMNLQGRTIIRRNILTRGERLYRWSVIPSDPDTTCNDMNEPHYITREQALHWIGNVGSSGMQTYSEWFDIHLLRAFAYEGKHDGIRIYIAKHDSVERDTTLNNKDMCIIETTRHHFLAHRDYFDCSVTKSFFEYEKSHGLLDLTNPGGQDKGELCPASCNP